jgi:hypothetical protein
MSSLGKQAFYGCSSLTEVIISKGVEAFGDEVFKNCGNLERITIPSTMHIMGSGVFSGCPKLSIRCNLYQRPHEWEEDWNPDGLPVRWKR